MPKGKPLANSGEEAIERLQRAIEYRFSDPELLILALTHSSLAAEEHREPGGSADNEQLEFLGDAVLGLAAAEHLFRVYPDMDEGSLTRLRARFVNRQHLAEAARKLSLGECLRLSKGEEKSGGRRKTAILANAMEAMIGAVFLDGGLVEASKLVRLHLIDPSLDRLAAAARAGESVGDYKSILQEHFDAHGMGHPRYEVTSESGPDHRKKFVVALRIADPAGGPLIVISASGSRKKDAEQEVAGLALERLRTPHPASVEKDS